MSIPESHIEEDQPKMNPIDAEESDEECIPLIDPRKSKTKKFQPEISKSVNPVAEPVTSVQNIAESSSVQHVTEQATRSKISIQAQQTTQFLDQSI